MLSVSFPLGCLDFACAFGCISLYRASSCEAGPPFTGSGMVYVGLLPLADPPGAWQPLSAEFGWRCALRVGTVGCPRCDSCPVGSSLPAARAGEALRPPIADRSASHSTGEETCEDQQRFGRDG